MKRIIACFVALLLVLQAGAQNNGNNKSLLWRISGKGMSKPSYLFGTIHMIKKDDYVWTDKMKESLAKSDALCLEMDLSDPKLQMEVAKGFIDKSGKKLPDYFTPQQYALLTKYMKDTVGMSITLFEQMKPVAVEMMLITAGYKHKNTTSYEETLMAEAQQEKKKIMGLEAAQEQLDVIESVPTDTVVKTIMDEIQNTFDNDSEYYEMVATYKKQDLPKLYSEIATSKDMADEMGPFLSDRNKKWIARIQKDMSTSSVFFAVGAGHLWGDAGVIYLLRKEGYTVEAVR